MTLSELRRLQAELQAEQDCVDRLRQLYRMSEIEAEEFLQLYGDNSGDDARIHVERSA